MIDRLKVSRVVNADLDRCHSLVADVESYGSGETYKVGLNWAIKYILKRGTSKPVIKPAIKVPLDFILLKRVFRRSVLKIPGSQAI